VEQAKVEVIASPQFPGEADLPGALQNTGGTAPDDSGAKTTTPPATTPPGSSSNGTTNGGTTNGTTTGATPATPSVPEDGTDAEKPDPAKDYQLSRALDLLHGLALIEASKAN
jgi:hypothetical protein